MERAFKGIWIPKEIWLSEDLGWTEKFLLAEIDSLSQNGECFASNEYFAKFFHISKDRISKLISSLTAKGYVETKLIYKTGTKQVEKRVITTIGYRRKQLEGIGENNYTPIGENAEDINTSFINPIINTKEIYIPIPEIVSYLNERASTNYKASSKKTKDLIKARWNEGFVLEDFKRVIDTKCTEWLNNKEMCVYLRPETLFGTKFESYLNQKGTGSKGSIFGNKTGWLNQPKRSLFEQGEESKKRQAAIKPLTDEEREQMRRLEEELPY